MDDWAALYAIIRRFEGLSLRPYQCPAGIPTIGYGHTGKAVTMDMPAITLAKAEALLQEDVRYYIDIATTLSPILRLYPNRHIAITDFCYNLGETRYTASTLRRCVNREAWVRAQDEIMKWVWGGGKKLPGLMLRRMAEARLLL